MKVECGCVGVGECQMFIGDFLRGLEQIASCNSVVMLGFPKRADTQQQKHESLRL